MQEQRKLAAETAGAWLFSCSPGP